MVMQALLIYKEMLTPEVDGQEFHVEMLTLELDGQEFHVEMLTPEVDRQEFHVDFLTSEADCQSRPTRVHPSFILRAQCVYFLVWKRRCADVRAGTQAPPLRFRLGR